MKPKGFDGSERDKARIDGLKVAKPGAWAQTPIAAALDRDLGQVTPLHVLTVLCKYRNAETLDCFPSMKRLAEDLGLSDRRSIQRHIDKLVERGFVVVIPRRTKDGSTNTSNGYVVLYPMTSFPDAGTTRPEVEAAKEAGATPSTTGVVTHGATGYPEEQPAPPWHLEPTPVAHDGEPRGTMCRTNEPTGTSPSMNEPSAEAGTLARAAAAEEAQVEIGNEGAKAKSEAPAKLPPKLASHLRTLAKVTGRPEADFVALVAQWCSNLARRGVDADVALDRVSWEVRRIPATAYAWEALQAATPKDTTSSGETA